MVDPTTPRPTATKGRAIDRLRADGADDNAAAIALEVAARLRARPAARPVVIAQFDAEEPPFFHAPAMGSTRFHDPPSARSPRTPHPDWSRRSTATWVT